MIIFTIGPDPESVTVVGLAPLVAEFQRMISSETLTASTQLFLFLQAVLCFLMYFAYSTSLTFQEKKGAR